MSMQDPISDMLTRIRNAQAAKEATVSFPASKLKLAMLNVLKDEGYIQDFQLNQSGNKKDISVTLKYYQGKSVIEKITRVSRPGLRVYRTSKDLPVVKAGMGTVIVSTPSGVMTGKTAAAQKLGGEVLCTVE